jgi:hypothetical protein
MNLKAIKERCEQAVPGQWRYDEGTLFVGAYFQDGGATSICEVNPKSTLWWNYAENNGRFIAGARTDLPALVSWIERAKGLLDLLLSEPFYLEAYAVNIQEEARKLLAELES